VKRTSGRIVIWKRDSGIAAFAARKPVNILSAETARAVYRKVCVAQINQGNSLAWNRAIHSHIDEIISEMFRAQSAPNQWFHQKSVITSRPYEIVGFDASELVSTTKRNSFVVRVTDFSMCEAACLVPGKSAETIARATLVGTTRVGGEMSLFCVTWCRPRVPLDIIRNGVIFGIPWIKRKTRL
ncbi:hypothetical protein COOONC_19835, partial [Cooperia oncophora]